MAELIIDTPGACDPDPVFLNLLKEAGINVEEGECNNTCFVQDDDVTKVEEILVANNIEFQWSMGGDEFYVCDEDDEDEDDEDEDEEAY